jgi:hypothetical protein
MSFITERSKFSCQKELVLDEWFFTGSCMHFGADYNYEGMTACMKLALMIR